MKKCICFFALLTIACSAFSQSIDLPKEQLNSLLAKNWRLKYTQIGAIKLLPKQNAPNLKAVFLKDTNLVIINRGMEKKPAPDQWTFNPADKFIAVYKDKKLFMKIVELSATEMKAIIAAPEQTATGESFYILESYQ